MPVLAMLSGTASADNIEPGFALVKRGSPSSFDGEVTYSSDHARDKYLVTPSGGVKIQGSGLDRGAASASMVYGTFASVMTINPESHGEGGVIAVGVEMSSENNADREGFEGAGSWLDVSSITLHFLVKQAGGTWKSSSEFSISTAAEPPTRNSESTTSWSLLTAASDGRSMPDWTQTYQVQIQWRVESHFPFEPWNNLDIHHKITSHWVWVAGNGSDDDQSGGDGDGGDGDDGNGGGGGKPSNKDPGDNPSDDPPGDKEPPDPSDSEEPGTGIECIDELKEKFKDKFPKFDQSLTGGNNFWKVEWDFEIPGQQAQTIYWSTAPDTSWGVGEALDKLRKWVRTISIILMVVFTIRQVVLALRQW